MIEYLSGTLLDKTPTKAIISAAGVGYGALISLATYEQLPPVGQQASLHTHLAVREDALTLYGFSASAERDMFLLLTTVTGVGPKSAIGMLSAMGVESLKSHIAQGAAASLTSLPGVGRKTAERIVLELRDKIGSVGAAGEAFGVGISNITVREEALAALVALGYNRAAAEKSIRTALKSGGPEVEESIEALIKAALRSINS